MPDESAAPSPEILREIQAAERKVECMVRAAKQEAAAILDKARSQTDALSAEKRRFLEQKKKDALANGMAEAEREAEQRFKDAQVKTSNLKAKCMKRMNEAVELVLKRILPQPCDPLASVGWNTGHEGRNAEEHDGIHGQSATRLSAHSRERRDLDASRDRRATYRVCSEGSGADSLVASSGAG